MDAIQMITRRQKKIWRKQQKLM